MKLVINLMVLFLVSCGHSVPEVTEGKLETTTTTTSPIPVQPGITNHSLGDIVLEEENDFTKSISLSSLGINTSIYTILPQTLHGEVLDNGNGLLEYKFNQALLSEIEKFEDGRFQDIVEVFSTDSLGETRQHRISLSGIVITDFDGSDVSGSDGGSDDSGSVDSGSTEGGSNEGGDDNGGAIVQINNDRIVLNKDSLVSGEARFFDVLDNDELTGFTVTGIAVNNVSPFETVSISSIDNTGVIARGLDTLDPTGFSVLYTVFGRNNSTGLSGELGSASLSIIIEDESSGSEEGGSTNGGDNSGDDTGNDSGDVNPVETPEHQDICDAFALSENTKLEAVYTHRGHFGGNPKPACSLSKCFGQGESLGDQVFVNNAVDIEGKRYKVRVEDFEGTKIARLCYAPLDKDNQLSIHNENLDFLSGTEGFEKTITVIETKGEMPLELNGLSTIKVISKGSLSNVDGSHLKVLGEEVLGNGSALKLSYDIEDLNIIADLDINTFYHDSYTIEIKDNTRVIYTVKVNVSFRIKGVQEFVLRDQITEHTIDVFSFFGSNNPDKILNEEIELSSLASVFSDEEHTIISLDCLADGKYDLQENDGSEGNSSFHFVWRDPDLGNFFVGDAKVNVACTGSFLNEVTGDVIEANEDNPLRIKFD